MAVPPRVGPPSSPPSENKVALVPLDHQQEAARRRLAMALVGILALEVVGVMLGMLIPLVLCSAIPIDAIKELMLLIFSPTVALVGSAAGFYFGSQTRSSVGRLRPEKA